VVSVNTAQQLSRQYLSLVRRFALRPLRRSDEVQEAVAVLSKLAKRGRLSRDEEDYYDVLATLVRQYEQAHLPQRKISPPNELLEFLMDQHKITISELAKVTGQRSHLSEFLNGKRKCSASLAIKLGKHFNVDPNLFQNLLLS
jgi:HTH-type transcriptional regulator/antitoxin HigA